MTPNSPVKEIEPFIKVIDLDKDIKVSVARMEKLKAGRIEENIPLNDEYWKALNKHRMAYNK